MLRHPLAACGALLLAGSAVLAAPPNTTSPYPQYTPQYQSNRFYNEQYRFYPYTSGGYAPRDYYQGYSSYYGNGYHPYYNFGYHPYYGYGTNLNSPSYSSGGNYGYYPSYADILSERGNAAGRRQSLYTPSAADTIARITVAVPEGAEVWFDGHKTQATGPVRVFETPELASGKRYGYTVRARWEQDGKDVTQTQKLVVTPGAELQVNFPAPRASDRGEAPKR